MSIQISMLHGPPSVGNVEPTMNRVCRCRKFAISLNDRRAPCRPVTTINSPKSAPKRTRVRAGPLTVPMSRVNPSPLGFNTRFSRSEFDVPDDVVRSAIRQAFKRSWRYGRRCCRLARSLAERSKRPRAFEKHINSEHSNPRNSTLQTLALSDSSKLGFTNT